MPDAPVTINVGPSSQTQTFTVQLEPRPPSWTDPSIYAPTLPGVVVAVLGLWVAHKFAAMRDRRKEFLELRDVAKDALDEAESSSSAAWLAPADATRPEKLMLAKSKLQAFGTTATDLRRRTKQSLMTHLRHVFWDVPLAVDVVNDVARLRDLVTSDPFDDPNRQPDSIRASDIAALCAQIRGLMDMRFFQLYG